MATNPQTSKNDARIRVPHEFAVRIRAAAALETLTPGNFIIKHMESVLQAKGL